MLIFFLIGIVMLLLPNGLNFSIFFFIFLFNIPVDFLKNIAALATNYTAQIKDALHYFSVALYFLIFSEMAKTAELQRR